MGYVANYLNDQVNAKQADLIVEDTLANLKQRDKLLDKLMPMKTYDSRDITTIVMRKVRTVASIVAYNAEIPIARQGNFERINAQLFKMGLTHIFPEDLQWQIKAAMELAQAKGVTVQDQLMPNGTVVKGTANSLADTLFGTMEDLVRAHIDRLDSLAWQILQFGYMSLRDSRTNADLGTVDFRNANDTSYNHFPTALSGANTWDQYATANGIQDLYNAYDTYVDTNGFGPDMILMSRKLRNDLMQQTATKNAASSLTVTQVGQVSPDMLKAVLNARDLPPIEIFDEMYEEPDANGNDVKTRFLNTNRFVFVKAGMGERSLGPVLEASNDNATIYVNTREVTRFPLVDATSSVSTALPLVANPKHLYSLQCRA